MLRRLIVFGLLTVLAAAASAKSKYLPYWDSWQDTGRNRTIPYKAYIPAARPGPFPIVLFSHGLGGNRDSSEFILQHLASYGVVAIAVQHPGSDTAALKPLIGPDSDAEDLAAALTHAARPENVVQRFRDVSFAIDALTAANEQPGNPFAGLLDLKRIGMSGHSFGALTTLTVMGQSYNGQSYTEPRITAGIVYSPAKPRDAHSLQTLVSIDRPTFHMTGTEDGNPLSALRERAKGVSGLAIQTVRPEDRLVPYAQMSAADKYLLVLKGGDHLVFSGRRLRGYENAKDAAMHDLIKDATLAFWNAHLRGEPKAQTYLTGGAFAAKASTLAHYEFRRQVRLK